MAIDIGKAYVQIVPSAQGISGSISRVLNGESINAGKSAGNNLGLNLISGLKGIIAAAGIGAFIKESISQGADLQQSIGGIETLFGAGGLSVEQYAEKVGSSVEKVQSEYDGLMASQERMMSYANEAYSSAGLSANDYMQTVTSFAASLKQSVGGDMETLTSVANQAVIDMADNANKMGTDMGSIQNAYQGFAKQNYTMLDNLKLGYGGTKTEMQRLLKDAQKISGIKYDISNLSDVYSAIHVIQGELGITGTTAAEAAGTISGSFASLQAAFSNVMANLALGQDLTPSLQALVQTASTFLFENLIPAVVNIVSALPGAIGTAFMEFLPTLSEQANLLINSFCTFLQNDFPLVLQQGLDMLVTLSEGFAEGFPEMAAKIIDMIVAIAQAIWDNREQILEIGRNLIMGLVDGVLEAAARLIEAVLDAVKAAYNAVKEFLGIESPSKKFRWIGEMTGEGLALGIEDNADMVQRSMNKLMDPVNNPKFPAKALPYNGAPAPGGNVVYVTFDIDNSGKDITDDDIRKWSGIIDEILGGEV